MSDGNARLHSLSFALAFGVYSAFMMFMLGLCAHYNWGSELMANLGSMYKGFSGSGKGIFIGTLWGLVAGYIGGLVIAVTYNHFCGSLCCKD